MAFNPLIIKDKYASLKEGYPVYINMDSIRPFTAKVGADIPFGSLLVKTAALKVYEAAQNVAVAITDALQVVGIAMATNVKLNVAYPGSTSPVAVRGGEQGDNVENGEIAVQIVGSAPAENSKVYLITVIGDQAASTLGRVTADSAGPGTSTVIELPQFKFTGLTDTASGLTVLKKLY